MLKNPLPQNQNMNSRIVDPGGASSGTPNLSDTASGHGCINMLNATNVVTHSKDYGKSQPDLGKKPAPPESSLRIENPSDNHKASPRIPKGFLKCSGHNPNAQATENYSIIEDLGQTSSTMSALELSSTKESIVVFS